MKHVAILVAASPTPAFFSQIAVLARALQQLRWHRWRYSLHVYVGGVHESDALDAWVPHLRDVHVRWSSISSFARDGDWAQSDDVFRNPPADADVFLALDADTLPVDAFESVLDRVLETNTVAGVIAHYPTVLPFSFNQATGAVSFLPPSPGWPATSVRDAWQRLALGIWNGPLEFLFSHTLMGADVPITLREAPFYLNFGVVFFPKPVFAKIAPTYVDMRHRLMDRLPLPDFSGQVALTLAIASSGANTWALPMRYNLPNDPVAERMYPQELEHVAIFHYLRTAVFDRHLIFLNQEHYQQFLSLQARGVNRRFQEAIRRIVGDVYPFA